MRQTSCASAPSRSGFGSSTRPSSSPRRASSRATRSIHGGGGGSRSSAVERRRRGRAPRLQRRGPGHRRHRAGAAATATPRAAAWASASAARSGWSTSSRSTRRRARAPRHDRALEMTRDASDRRSRSVSRGGAARRAAESLAATLGLGDDARGRVALVVTELATNLVQPRRRRRAARCAVEPASHGRHRVLALDRGPGMADVGRLPARRLLDRRHAPATGLGAIAPPGRPCSTSARPGQGTAVLARIWRAPGRRDDGRRSAAVCSPCTARTVAATAGPSADGDGVTIAAVVDGLGHGPAARRGRGRGRPQLSAQARRVAEALLETIHARRCGRPAGAAVGVAALDLRRTDGELRRHRQHRRPIVGRRARRGARLAQRHRSATSRRDPGASTIRSPAGALLVMHSDGRQRGWALDRYPGLVRRDPLLIAGVLYRDFTARARRRDACWSSERGALSERASS